MSRDEPEGIGVAPVYIVDNDTQSKVGIALLVLAGVPLFGPVALGLPFVYEASAVLVSVSRPVRC